MTAIDETPATVDTVIAEPLVPAAAGEAPTDAPVVGPTAAEGVAPTPTARRSRRLHVVAGLRWLIARTVAIVVFVAGVGLGYSAFLATQPPPTVAVDPATAGLAAPAVVQEFIAALTSNDTAALRSAVPAEPYQLLIAEMDRWSFKTMTDVKTLATYVDGPRTATELVLTGVTTSGTTLSVNLVVHVDADQIVSFR